MAANRPPPPLASSSSLIERNCLCSFPCIRSLAVGIVLVLLLSLTSGFRFGSNSLCCCCCCSQYVFINHRHGKLHNARRPKLHWRLQCSGAEASSRASLSPSPLLVFKEHRAISWRSTKFAHTNTRGIRKNNAPSHSQFIQKSEVLRKQSFCAPNDSHNGGGCCQICRSNCPNRREVGLHTKLISLRTHLDDQADVDEL